MGAFALFCFNASTHIPSCAITRETLGMINHAINFILISLLIFTPIAFASMDFWAFSLMELAILFMIILWAIQCGLVALKRRFLTSEIKTPNVELPPLNSHLRLPGLILLALFLCLIIFQMIPLPSV